MRPAGLLPERWPLENSSPDAKTMAATRISGSFATESHARQGKPCPSRKPYPRVVDGARSKKAIWNSQIARSRADPAAKRGGSRSSRCLDNGQLAQNACALCRLFLYTRQPSGPEKRGPRRDFL